MLGTLLLITSLLPTIGSNITTVLPTSRIITTIIPTTTTEACPFGSTNIIHNTDLVNIKSNPKTFNQTYNSFFWTPSRRRPNLELTFCDYASIKSVTFRTSNVKSSGIRINDRGLIGRPDSSSKKVRVESWEGSGDSKVGSKVKITVTPINYSLPVEISEVIVEHCGYAYDCFEECAVYVLDEASGCYKPLCTMDPCNYLYCYEGQECRLIEGVPREVLPSLLSSSYQVWACVDTNRKNYGCVPKKKKKDEDGCPTCKYS